MLRRLCSAHTTHASVLLSAATPTPSWSYYMAISPMETPIYYHFCSVLFCCNCLTIQSTTLKTTFFLTLWHFGRHFGKYFGLSNKYFNTSLLPDSKLTVQSLSECIEPSLSQCIHVGHRFAWSGLQWTGQGEAGSQARVGCAEHSFCSILTP